MTRQQAMADDRINGLTTDGRNPDGTFTSGNPGRPAGSRHKTTLAMQILLDGEAEALTRKAVEQALTGDTAALRLCLERLCPPRRDTPIQLDLPPLRSARDVADAVAAVTAAVCQGEITPLEAASVVGLLDAYRRTLELTEIEERVIELERVLRVQA